MPRNLRPAKRANRSNPREDRNLIQLLPDFVTKEPRKRREQSYEERKRIKLLPQSIAQENYIDALMDDDKYIVLASGCAGTGKTYLATLYAIKAFQDGLYKKIIITRPAVSVDESLGYLPGSLQEKLQPWCIPVLDVFKEYFSIQMLKKLLENESIKLAALGYMRGRNLKIQSSF